MVSVKNRSTQKNRLLLLFFWAAFLGAVFFLVGVLFFSSNKSFERKEELELIGASDSSNQKTRLIANKIRPKKRRSEYQQRLKKLPELEFKKENKVAYSFKTLDDEIVEVGTESHSPPQPYLKLNKWEGEESIRIDVPYQTTKLPKRIGNKLRYTSTDGKVEVDFYTKEPEKITEKGPDGKERAFTINSNGGVEFDTILHEKPKTNRLEFPIRVKNLIFYYQPALHPDHPTWSDDNNDGKPDSYRPEQVVGSYAVYHKNRSGDYSELGGKNYKTGKAFHLYRPKIWDAEANETWGELKIDESNEILSVIIPQDFLDSAVYPITVDPIFGSDDTGDTGETQYSNTLSCVVWETPTDLDEISKLTAYVSQGLFQSGHHYKAVIGDSNGDVVSNGVGNESGVMPDYGETDWVDSIFSITPSVSANADYFFGSVFDGTSTFYYDSTDTTHDSYHDEDNSYASPENPFSGISGTKEYSIYATYTALEKENGESCSSNSDCLSGKCVDGVCCETACSGVCEACDISGSEGACTNIAEDTDPDNECDQNCANACADQTGDCDGSGACKSTYCAQGEACSGGTCGTGNYCNGSAFAYCSCQGAGCYSDGGFDYVCQGQCDGSGSCTYAANCSTSEEKKNTLELGEGIDINNLKLGNEQPPTPTPTENEGPPQPFP